MILEGKRVFLVPATNLCTGCAFWAGKDCTNDGRCTSKGPAIEICTDPKSKREYIWEEQK